MNESNFTIRASFFASSFILCWHLVACSTAQYSGTAGGAKNLKKISQKAEDSTRQLADPQPKKTTENNSRNESTEKEEASSTSDTPSTTSDTQDVIFNSPCEILKSIALKGEALILKNQACIGRELSPVSKQRLNSPLALNSLILVEQTHYTAQDLGPETNFKAHLAARHPVSCAKMVHEIGDKVALQAKTIGDGLLKLNQKTSKISEINSQGGIHIKGATYQVEDSISATIINSNDSYQLVINVYGDLNSNHYVSVEETLKPGSKLKNRTTLSLMRSTAESICDVLIYSDMLVDNSGWHNMLVKDFMVPGLKNSLAIGLNEAEIHRRSAQ